MSERDGYGTRRIGTSVYREEDVPDPQDLLDPPKVPRCPVHDLPDCSPLLNGCSRLTAKAAS